MAMRKLFRTIISIIIVSIIIGFIGLLQLGNNVAKSSNNINSEQASIENMVIKENSMKLSMIVQKEQ